MAFTVSISLKGKTVEGQAVSELMRTIRKTKIAILMQLANDVADETPVGVSGQLRAGVNWREDRWNMGRVYETGPGARYVEVVEKGRKKNKKFPPPDAIRLWLKRTDKGKAFVAQIRERYNLTAEKALDRKALDRKALDRAVFLKSRAIAKYGTKAVKMWDRTFKKRKGWISRKFRTAIAEFTK